MFLSVIFIWKYIRAFVIAWLLTLQRPGVTVLESFDGANIPARSSEKNISTLASTHSTPSYSVVSAEVNAERRVYFQSKTPTLL